jgi:S-disulfanyl-L-cysteine oxidoreductase SoxD
MSRSPDTRRPGRIVGAGLLAVAMVLPLAFALAGPALAQTQTQTQTQTAAAAFVNVGRAATPQEVAAWNIDVRPDFKGLPPGSGSVAQGQDVWEAKCASCHGIFGESNQTFSPLVGGTTPEDIKTGRVARLMDPAFPGRTTLMKVSSLSTLWDYINRAMPWTAPKSLKTDEVYAVTAYLLNLGGILPDSFVLSDHNMAEVQGRLPNRNGVTTAHGLWPGKGLGNGGKPDVAGRACMSNCVTEAKVASTLPDFARNAHGNLAEQNRSVGAQHGVDTTLPPPARLGASRTAQAATPAVVSPNAAAMALTQKHTCVACHSVDNRIVGPSFKEVASKYGQRSDAVAYLSNKIRAGGAGLWGAIPMPPQQLDEADAKRIAQWLVGGAAP